MKQNFYSVGSFIIFFRLFSSELLFFNRKKELVEIMEQPEYT